VERNGARTGCARTNAAARQILHLLLIDAIVCIAHLVLQELRTFSHHQQAAIKASSMDTTNRLQLQQQQHTDQEVSMGCFRALPSATRSGEPQDGLMRATYHQHSLPQSLHTNTGFLSPTSALGKFCCYSVYIFLFCCESFLFGGTILQAHKQLLSMGGLQRPTTAA
jgi:hypothetical protein